MLRSGWLTMGPRTAGVRGGVRRAPRRPPRGRGVQLHRRAAPRLPRRGRRAGDEVIVPSMTFAATAAAVATAAPRRCSPTSSGPHDLGLDPDDVEAAHHAAHQGGLRRALRRLSGRRSTGCGDLCDAHGPRADRGRGARPRAPTLAGRKLGTLGLAAAFSFFSNKVLSCGEGGLLATDDDEVAALARSLRSHGMTSGTWDRHTGDATPTTSSDSASTTASTSRGPRCCSRGCRGWRRTSRAGARSCARYRELLRRRRRASIVPYADDDVDAAPATSCRSCSGRATARRRPRAACAPSTASRPASSIRRCTS